MIFVPYFIGSRTREAAQLAPADTVLPPLPGGSAQVRMGVLYAELARRVASTDQPRVQVGDCVATLGVLVGLQAQGLDPALVWLDSHGDFNTWETTPSGFLGGMPLAMIAGLGEQTIVEAVDLRPVLGRRLLLVGARDLDPGEDTNLEVAGVRQAEVEDLSAGDLPEGPIYLHLDCDLVRACSSIDPSPARLHRVADRTGRPGAGRDRPAGQGGQVRPRLAGHPAHH